MDYGKLLSPAAKAMRPSGIRKFFDIAAEMKDCITLGVGEPDFKTPWSIREAGIKSLEKGHTFYTSNTGMVELRQEICTYMQRRFGLGYNAADEVLVTVGGSEAIDACIRALVSPGEEVLIPEPSFVCYHPLTTLVGGVPVTIPLKNENDFRLTAEELRAAITPKTKLLVFPFPTNPTGGVMRKADLEAIAEVLRGTDIMVLSDEIYAELTYGGEKHISIASLPGMAERTVVVNGFSKAYAMTGWRLGFACGPAPVIGMMNTIHQAAIMCAPTTSQYAAIVALRECDDEIERMRDEYDLRRRFLMKRFEELGLPCFEPQGAFYVFPDIRGTGLSSAEFCEQLLVEAKVAMVPGTAFGDSGEGFLRISYAYSLDHLDEAMRRTGIFLEKQRQKA
ncbi:MAG: aminotransferase class I/II-fold pyridoxal phosphate-dependent enzyme [Ruminococcaceae bacterium]|nr:aminotransferase class I/II-fold pyridoxal phosphate-dependent enzyme [Oscillospiraceae bacterium]